MAICDIVILVIILLFALFGLRGFFKSLSGFIGFVGAVVAAILLCDLVVKFANDIPFVASFRQGIEDKMVAANSEFGNVQAADYYTSDLASTILSGLGIPAWLAGLVATPFTTLLQGIVAKNAEMTVAQVVAEATAGNVIKIAVLIILIIVLAIVIKILAKSLNKLCCKTGITKFINGFVGVIFNMVIGIAFVMIVDYLLTKVIVIQAIVDMKASSAIFNWLGTNNILTAILSGGDVMTAINGLINGAPAAFAALFGAQA